MDFAETLLDDASPSEPTPQPPGHAGGSPHWSPDKWQVPHPSNAGGHPVDRECEVVGDVEPDCLMQSAGFAPCERLPDQVVGHITMLTALPSPSGLGQVEIDRMH